MGLELCGFGVLDFRIFVFEELFRVDGARRPTPQT